MPRSHFSVVFAGSGGAGAMTAGAVFLRAAARAGYYGLMTQLFGPQVRGGEAAALVQISATPINAQPDRFDLFIALDWEKIDQFAAEIPLDDTSVILADPVAGAIPPSIAKSKARVVALAMSDPGDQQTPTAPRRLRFNIFAAGAAAALAGIDAGHVQAALTDVLGSKGGAVLEANMFAAQAGARRAAALSLGFTLAPPARALRWVMTGNQATALGALRGGVRFVAAYPITPATDLVEWLAPELPKLGGRLVLAEDEIAAINMALGASFGGVPAMTVTSGPGLSLMVETLGLAVAAEIPLVIVNVMRAGPSTGIPSKTEQGDLNLALYGAHGDAPRIVLAPMSVGDCLTTAEWAVYLAEGLQLPAIVLCDQALAQSFAVIDPIRRRAQPMRRRTEWPTSDMPFKRYAIGPDPITPMPLPGTPGLQWVAEGLTHNEAGLPVSAARAHVAQMNKRAKKLDHFDPADLWGEIFGEGDTVVVTFGSSTGPVQEAARQLAGVGRSVRVIALRMLSPLPAKQLRRALEGARRIFVVEQNHGAQLFHHLVGHRAIWPTAESVARPGPLPFRPSEIASYVA